MVTKDIFSRDFVYAFLAQFSLSSAFLILVPTLPLYLSNLGSSEAEIGLLLGALGMSSLVLRPFVGKALLRIPEKKFMIAGSTIGVFSSIAYLAVFPFWPFLTLRVLQGTVFAFFYTASFTLIGRISPEAHRGESLSYYYLSYNISFALAPPFGMWIIIRFGFTSLFLVCAGLFLCSFVFNLGIGRRRLNHFQQISEPEGVLLNRKALPPSLMAFFTNTMWAALTAFFPLYAVSQGVSNPGYFFTTFAVVLILSRALGGRVLDRYSREKVILPCLVIYILTMGAMAFSKTLLMFILVAVFCGIAQAFFFPAILAYVIDRAGSRGTAMGTFTAMQDLGMGLGPAIMGLILRWTNYPTMFLCLALTGFINFNYFYFLVRKK